MRQLNVLLLGLFLSYSNVTSAESEARAIRKVIQQYINGSSYSLRDEIIQAFHPNATLYLSGKQGFARYSPTQYANLFAQREPGKFNGRIGKILSVEVVNDIASAKASINISEYERLYIDLFLLKKISGRWQIISKTATRLPED